MIGLSLSEVGEAAESSLLLLLTVVARSTIELRGVESHHAAKLVLLLLLLLLREHHSLWARSSETSSHHRVRVEPSLRVLLHPVLLLLRGIETARHGIEASPVLLSWEASLSRRPQAV